VSLTEDQHAVGEFGSEGADESFGEAVRSWAVWRNLDGTVAQREDVVGDAQALFPAACHVTEQYANNAVEADHGRLTARLRSMRDVKRLCSARVISAGHAFVQNLCRGHYELGLDIDQRPQLTVIFTELARAI
jgi:transposase-like protein